MLFTPHMFPNLTSQPRLARRTSDIPSLIKATLEISTTLRRECLARIPPDDRAHRNGAGGTRTHNLTLSELPASDCSTFELLPHDKSPKRIQTKLDSKASRPCSPDGPFDNAGSREMNSTLTTHRTNKRNS